MRRPRVSARVAIAGSLVALLLLAAGATTAGYLLETHSQQSGRNHRLAVAAAFVEHGKAQAETTRWQQTLSEKLAALGLGATLALIGPPDGKRLLHNQSAPPSTGKPPADMQPTASYLFGAGHDQSLRLDLYAPPLDQTRRLLVAFASGLAALLVGTALLIWAASRWLVAPLRRLNTQVDAIAGGDPIETRASSPILEVDHVAAAVESMATTLARTAEREAQLEAGRRLLVSSIAHDLRTPLFSLRGYLDAIATGIGNPRERLDQARSKADQIDRLVTSLFDYTRADVDQRPRLETTDLAEAVTDTTAALEIAAHERGIRLRVTALTSPAVTIDRAAVDRALSNVLDNALRHTPPGGTIDVTCGEGTDGAFVQVVDDGPGIAPDLLPQLFEPIVRADSKRNGGANGAGLGLTIAARLLRNQGATINAANAPGRGAELTLRLPRAPRRLGA
jgi:signal transduction histidine kinase